jgi:ABC-type phosphate transport system permease subunit
MIPVAASHHYIQAHRGYARRKTSNTAMLLLTGLVTALMLVPLFWIIGYVVYQGGKSIDLSFFTQLPRPPGISGGGVLNAIEGTILLIILASLFAIEAVFADAGTAAKQRRGGPAQR